jgi:small-conductance mechanosensitive channel
MDTFIDGLREWARDGNVRALAALLLGLTLVLLVRRSLPSLITRLVDESFDRLGRPLNVERRPLSPRALTLQSYASRVTTVVVVAMLLLYAATLAGVRVTPFFASAGILGVAVAFGAQTLVRDVLSGVFILLDGPYNLGDYVQLNNVQGVVTEIALRRTMLVGDDGSVHTVPNGAITQTSNYTPTHYFHVTRLKVQRTTPIERVVEAVRAAAAELAVAPEVEDALISGPEVQGISALGGATYEVSVRSVLDRRLRVQWPYILNGRLLAAFEEAGVELEG